MSAVVQRVEVDVEGIAKATASLLREQHTPFTPAKAGVQFFAKALGPRFRGDERGLTQSRNSKTLGHATAVVRFACSD